MNTLFGLASEFLTERLRGSVFAAILEQDIAFFDDEKNTVGALTSSLSSDAQKVQGVSGVTLGNLLTVTVNLVGGMAVALAYGWQLGLVAICCIPLLGIHFICVFNNSIRGTMPNYHHCLLC